MASDTRTQHTPGPWRINHERIDGADGAVALICSTTSVRQAQLVDWPGTEDAEAEANARLIAAAPDLLAALVQAVEHAGSWNGIAAARTAIAKARGQ